MPRTPSDLIAISEAMNGDTEAVQRRDEIIQRELAELLVKKTVREPVITFETIDSE